MHEENDHLLAVAWWVILISLDLYYIYIYLRNNFFSCVKKKSISQSYGITLQIPVWSSYQEILNDAEKTKVEMVKLDRFVFYERAKHAYAVVATGETTPYANIILKKGVIAGPDL